MVVIRFLLSMSLGASVLLTLVSTYFGDIRVAIFAALIGAATCVLLLIALKETRR